MDAHTAAESPAAGGRFSGRLALVAEYPPPAAGMTVQAQQLQRRLRAAGVEVVMIRTNPRLPGWLARVRYLRGLLRWSRFLWDCRRLRTVEVAHVFACSGLSFLLFVVPAVILARVWERGVVLHYHGGAAESFAQRHPRLVARTLARVGRLVVPSEYLREVFGRLGYPAEVIGNPTDLAAFPFRERPGGDPIVLSCRNLLPVYDVATSVRAFAAVVRRLPGARLLIAGDGPQLDELRRLAAELGIGAAVEFLGNVPNERMPELLARAQILINSSRVDNLPGSILEAFAAGVPVVSTDAGGIPWLVRDGVNGLLAPVGDWERLGAQAVRLIEDPGMATRLARQGRVTVEELSWERIGARWQAVYAALPSTRSA